MAWVIWLLVPLVAPALVALVSWVRGRPERTPTTEEAMRQHTAYLDALVQTARSRDRGPYAGPPAGGTPPEPLPEQSPPAAR